MSDPNFNQFIKEALEEDQADLIKEFLEEPDNMKFVFESVTFQLPDPIQYKCPITNASIYFNAPKCFNAVIEAGGSPNAVDAWGKSSAHFAAEYGRLDFMKDPHFEKAELVVIDWRGRLPIHYAAENNHVDVLRYLIEEKGADLTLSDNYGMTALHVACQHNATEAAVYLLEKGAQLTADIFGRTPLDFAAKFNAVKIIQYFVEKSPQSLNDVNENGQTILHRAVIGGALDVIPLLSPLANIKDKIGYTPLHYAGQYPHAGIVQALVNIGSDINATDEKGVTPLMIASSFNNQTVVDEILTISQLQKNAKDAKGRNALHHATMNSSYLVIPSLVHNGVDSNATDLEGHTPKETADGSFAKECRKLAAGQKIIIGDYKNPGRGPTYTKYTVPTETAQQPQTQSQCTIA
ncbi:hypothetical protein TVAG_120140 [Trichomonas vaginalis G3]|uniref:Uncharacterized protein n=1 Tax=Trichomonas vaginalis (strain ATCC PRA-98 / G3) TaxID=412133 RepID=A2D7G0_TRIV3|nr:spectrin binding [Trichomonas vaginalis G3]EAY23677.1 hypothetical protein TVAG_120140 [Trichomonas vaginalis G3]KAI5490169.1 spectrin binding [Trichomonas vaginalis G3]|eukprot:XP_001276925.1 hypothetical protein [Trichomonas vaginalis G3]